VNADHFIALLGGLVGFALAGLLTGVSEAVSLVALLAALCAAAAREAAILARRPDHDVRRLTAVGFFGGFVAGATTLVLAAIGVLE
jgi:hypothetical protein